MTSVLPPVLGLAILDSANPTAILVTVLLVLRAASAGTSPVRPVLAYVAGIYTAVLTLGVVALFALSALLAVADGVSQDVVYGVQFGVGVALLLVGALVPTHPRRPRRSPRIDRSVQGLVGLGLVVTAVELTTAVPYVGALALLSASEMPAPVQVLVLVVYAAVVVAPPLAVLAVSRAGGRSAQVWLERSAVRLEGVGRAIVLVLLFLLGLVVAGDAAWYFDFFGLVDAPARP